jgi:hypothetical protein
MKKIGIFCLLFAVGLESCKKWSKGKKKSLKLNNSSWKANKRNCYKALCDSDLKLIL